MVLIASTSFFGSTVNGSTRWLIIGPVQIQPSELIKPFIILQSAKLFGQWERINSEKKIFWLTIFASIILLIIKQPNLSTAALIGTLLWMIALASGINFRYLFNTALSGFLLGSISIFFNAYQQSRVMSFINPWKDPQGSGYQLIQSLYAIGSGGLFGEGYGLSMQKLQYLPYRSTDFIFAVFAEEFGFFGSILLLSFLLVIAYLTLKISINCRNNYSQLISIGSGTILVGQSIMHIAVSSGAMPTTGLPFPLISYGGNSLISSLLIAALLVRASIESSDLLIKNPSKRLLTR
jgi:cell division protein FtsW